MKREEPNCWLCGAQIDAWRLKGDPLAFQCDHVIRASVAPELAEVRSNLRASHAKCNRERERKTPTAGPGVYLTLDEF